MPDPRRAVLRALAALAAIALLSAPAGAAPVPLMNWPDLLGRPLPKPTEHIAYGQGPLQFGELWLPAGPGPFPVVLMVHGGCWLSGVAKLTIMNYAAEDLRQRGIAVWNVEYRGVDRPGGGYPGTFQDVAGAADKLAEIAPAHHLRTDHIVALGHSAGGHLVLWLAARGRLPADSPLTRAHPLRIAAVISTGGLPDLAYEASRGDDGCGADTVARLVGPATAAHPHVYADTSPAELGVGRDPEVLISGDQDPISPPDDGARYAARMKGQGADIRHLVVPDTGHVELIAPGTDAWKLTVADIERLLHAR